jgi:hypothetical protein
MNSSRLACPGYFRLDGRSTVKLDEFVASTNLIGHGSGSIQLVTVLHAATR